MIKRLLLGVIAVGLVTVGAGGAKVHAVSGIDMSITVHAPKKAFINQDVTQWVSATNLSSVVARQVIVKNTFTAPVIPKQWPTNCKWFIEQYNVNTLVCSFGDVKPGKSVYYNYSYATPFADQQVRTRHVVSANQADTYTSNNSVVTVTAIKQ